MGHYERLLHAFPDELEPENPPFPAWDPPSRKRTLRPGEGRVVLASRGGFDHVGLDMGDGSVIHWTGEIVAARDASIARTPTLSFSKGAEVRYAPGAELLNRHLTCLLALSHVGLGAGRYDPLASNCESVALFCATGVWASKQVLAILDRVGKEDGWGARVGAAADILATLALARLDWELSRQEQSEPLALVEPPSPVPYAYGELYQGQGGRWHTRAQVTPEWPTTFGGQTPGAWLPGPPWHADQAPERGWPLVGAGLGSLEDEHFCLVMDGCSPDVDFTGPWRNSPDTPLGKLGFLVGHSLELSLTHRAWLWVDHDLVVHVRADDKWLRGPRLSRRAIPGSGLSPVLSLAAA